MVLPAVQCGKEQTVGHQWFHTNISIFPSLPCRCIGSIQYLKNMFGKGYLLEIKVKHQERADLLHAEILRIFPSAARQEW